MLGPGEYAVFVCKIHKRIIHHFKRQTSFNETECWDCIRDANNKKSSQENKLKKAREEFSVEFTHLWTTSAPGGIVSAKITEGGINVSIESSSDVFNEVPNEYRGFAVSKQIVGATP